MRGPVSDRTPFEADATLRAGAGLTGTAWGWDACLGCYQIVPPGGILRPGHAYWVHRDATVPLLVHLGGTK